MMHQRCAHKVLIYEQERQISTEAGEVGGTHIIIVYNETVYMNRATHQLCQ
jgi:hypothetical protein